VPPADDDDPARDPLDDEPTVTDRDKEREAAAPEPAAGSFEHGSIFAGHRIEGLIGEGGMGRVYEATELDSGRTVAMKVLIPEISRDERQRSRFKREARVAAALDHPHVVPIHRAEEFDGRLFITMHLIEGGDVRDAVRGRGPLEPRYAITILRQVCSALDAAHEKGLVHRDIKPANLMLGGTAEEPHAYLTDFSLVRGGEGEETITKAGAIVGTLDYMAPEQLRGEEVDRFADIYALGCVLVYMLTGKPPYPRDSEPAIMWGHLGEPPPRPSELAEGVPPLLDEVVARAMAKEPGERFPSASYLGDAARLALGV